MKRRLVILFFLFGCILFDLPARADKIFKKDGSFIFCKILSIKGSFIEYQTSEHPFLRISRESISKLVYDDGTEMILLDTSLDNARKLKESKIKSEPEYHLHNGFYLRFALGAGRELTSWNSQDLPDSEIRGSTANWMIDIGGALDWNLLFFLQFGNLVSVNPALSQAGKDGAYKVLTSATSVTGLGLCYYFPSNTYLSLAYNMTEHTLDFDDGQSFTSGTGNGFYFSLGHEFWVSANWGLGLAVFYHYSKSKESPGAVKNRIYGLAFSATYN